MRAALPVIFVLLAGVPFGGSRCLAQPFTPIVTEIAPVSFGMLVLGDFDRNGVLDVFSADAQQARVVFNPEPGHFEDLPAGSPMFAESLYPLYHNGSTDIGDFDNDGDLDFLFSGDPAASYVYVNDGSGVLTPSPIALPGLLKSGLIDIVNSPASTWADVDNDGDLDILLVGYVGDASGTPTSVIYLNDGNGGFAEHTSALPAPVAGPPAWGDYNLDGYVDLLAGCYCEAGKASLRVFQNDRSGRFSAVGAPLLDAIPGSTRWGDYDNDGDLDILIGGRVLIEEQVSNSGSTRSFSMHPYLAVFRNDGESFMADTQVLPTNAYWADWADMNGDGYLDLITVSVESNDLGEDIAAIRIYANENGRFTQLMAELHRVWNGDVAIGDLDADGDLDIVLSGVITPVGGTGFSGTVIYRNDSPAGIEPPTSPEQLSGGFVGDRLVLSWAPPQNRSDAGGLTYNLRVGTTPGGMDVVAPLARSGGRLSAPRPGNVGPNLSYEVRGLDPTRTYYWSVQAVDHSLRGSPFAPELSSDMPVSSETESEMPYRFGIVDGYPNPFNPKAAIRYSMDETASVNVSVYDAQGRLLSVLVDGTATAGEHEISFNGAGLPSGTYLVRMKSGSRSDVRALTLLK